MLLSLLGEQNPERIDREGGTDRKVEEQEHGHDDREDAPPTPILEKPDTRSGDARGDREYREAHNHYDGTDERHHRRRKVRRPWNRQASDELAGEDNHHSRKAH